MTGRERIKTIISGESADRCGLWLGNPHADSLPPLYDHFGVSDGEAMRRVLDDDFRWVCPQFYENAYCHPEGLGMFDAGLGFADKNYPLADCRSVGDIEKFTWPQPDYLNFEPCLDDLRNLGDVYRASGYWTSFYHDIMGLFGMENYMMNMYTQPELVLAVTDKVCEFYYEANERFFAAAGDLVDGFFFGNDFGTQLDLICGPEQFDQFIMPWFDRFTQQAHKHGYQAILHSCGAIHKVIDRLIGAGVDCLHPLQAKAAHMDAETLARDFKGRIAFMGGVDTQELLVHGTPSDIKAEVKRLKGLLGPCFIVSPSHEAVLPDIPPQNIEAMAEEAVV